MIGSKILLNLKKILLKKYNEESDEGYLFEVNVWVEKLAANLHDKTKYVMHMKNLKQAVNNELRLIKLHRFY